MKPIIWMRQVKVSTVGDSAPTGPPGQQGGQTGRRLSIADKAAFVVLAAGLLALGGVIFAAGLALLLALATGGLVLGALAVTRYRLFGPKGGRLAPGEIPADAEVLPSEKDRAALPGTPSAAQRPTPSRPAPRAD